MKQRWLFLRAFLRYPKSAMRLLTLIVLVCLSTAPAIAGATAWRELGPGARVRLITSDRVSAEGTMLAAIDLEMPDNMKTYWRVPGETGIATELDLSGSTGIAGHQLFWPYPQVEITGGYTDFVYYGPLVIPVELKIEGPQARLEASLLMGICSEICIPATAQFSLTLDTSEPDIGQEIRISQALAEVPIGWPDANEPVGEPLFDPAQGLIWVEVDPELVSPESLVVDAGKNGYLFGAPKKSRQDGLVSLPLLPSGDKGAGLAGTEVRLLFVTADGPYEIVRTVGLAPGAE
jgi:DsbC/DsbD-like thiol-disulfide interchange protein